MTKPTLAIGPANYAGQAYAWAQAVSTHLAADAWAFTPDRWRKGGFAFARHRRIPAPFYYLPLARNARARRFVADATHLLIDGFRPIYYDKRGFEAQARHLLAHGPTLGLFAHGTDVRDPDAHLARNAHSYFAEGDAAWLNERRRVTARNRAFARELGVPLFVSTPDMLFDLPEATWVPVCVDVDAWTSDRPLLVAPRPRVLFVPSQRTPPIKGTRFVDPVLRRLADAGVIDYIAPSGVPHAEMVELVKSVDVVVDQLLSGSYGVAAVEAMAAGRIVIGNTSSLTSAQSPELPRILTATPDDLGEVIASLFDRRSQLVADAEHNRSFVRHWHDGRESAARLAVFLQN